ncbi:MAG: flagellar hook capping protein [Ruminococcus sp.]|nr:flagellar hook capping protein [Ruminococcus sp.]
MPISSVSDRNYLDLMNGVQSEDPAKKYGIEYTTEEAGSMGYEDFLMLMVKQLTNQDFTNPTNDAEYMAQLTQYSTLQAMQEMTKLSQNNYAVSMVGKTVTASKYSNGEMIKETGVVEQIIRQDDEYQLMINGQSFTLTQIMSVGTGNDENADPDDKNNSAGAEKTFSADMGNAALYDIKTAMG